MGVPKILDPNFSNWFLQDRDEEATTGYPIDYGLVVLHALSNWLNVNSGFDDKEIYKERVKNILDDCFKFLNTETDLKPYREENFIEIYFLSGTDDSFCVVDQSNGSYPLILYGKKDRPSDKEPRTDGFKNRLRNIREHFEKVWPILMNSAPSNWDEEIQTSLLSVIPFKEFA
ncbi:MAG: hypothetical protein U1F57_09210 [bacterium]